MPTTPVGLTGKTMTFSFDGTEATAQITKASVSKSEDGAETVDTWGGRIDLPGRVESTVSAELLYDGHVVGNVHAVLDTALDSATDGVLVIEGTAGDHGWTGYARVTKLDAEIPADGALTTRVEFAIIGAFPFTGAIA